MKTVQTESELFFLEDVFSTGGYINNYITTKWGLHKLYIQAISNIISNVACCILVSLISNIVCLCNKQSAFI